MTDVSNRVEAVARAIGGVGRAVFGFTASTSIALDDPLLSDGQFALGGETLDSLDLVEFFACIEDETGVDILDAELEALATIRGLATYLVNRGDPEAIESFCSHRGDGAHV